MQVLNFFSLLNSAEDVTRFKHYFDPFYQIGKCPKGDLKVR